MANLVVHFEIHASDPQRLVEFYSALLGWRIDQFGDQPYWIIDTGEGSIGNMDRAPGLGINGGIQPRSGPRPDPGAPVNGCNIVVAVDGVDDVMRRAVELGATVAAAAEDWPGIGRGGYLLDPDGNLLGLLSPAPADGPGSMGGGG